MADLYVNPTSGRDVADAGNTPADPLHTITFAVAEAVRRFGAGFTTIHASDGLCNTASGEDFPILLPQNISLIGAGKERTIIDYARDLADVFDRCLQGGREIANLTIQGYPETPGACDVSVAINLIADDSYVHDVSVRGNPGIAAGEHAFGVGIKAHDLLVRIENVEINRCRSGIECSGPVTIRSSTFNENVAGVSLGSGSCQVFNCRFLDGNSTGVRVSPPSAGRIADCEFRRCGMAGVVIEPSPSSGSPPAETPHILHSTFAVETTFGILCDSDATVEENQILVADGWGRALTVGGGSRRGVAISANPIIRNNTVRRTSSYDPGARPLVDIGGACDPVFEGNDFGSAEDAQTLLLWIDHDAMPDLGGGPSGGRGQNRFAGGWIVIHADARSIRRDIFARSNFWRFVPPRLGGYGDYDIQPVDAPVTLHVEDAMRL